MAHRQVGPSDLTRGSGEDLFGKRSLPQVHQSLKRFQQSHADAAHAVMVGRDQIHQPGLHHPPRQPLGAGVLAPVVAVEAPCVHLQQRAQLPPAPHLVQRLDPRQIPIALRMGDDDPAAGIERFAHDHLALPWRSKPNSTSR